MRKPKINFSSFPLFITLLPIFFVTHGFIENYNFVPLDEAIVLALFYILISALIFLVAWLFYRDSIKAAVFTVCLMSFQFFFGSVFDGLKHAFPGSFIVKYSFILPCSLILLTLIFIMLKRRKKPLSRLVVYLNVLFIVLIVADLVFFIPKYFSLRKENRQALLADNFSFCKSCSRPDIYLIIADEYAGNKELTGLLQFDNSPFLDSLQKRGFHVMKESHSNYISTLSSMASFFDMNYLRPQKIKPAHDPGDQGFNVFRNNLSLRFLKKQGYTIINNSIFDLNGIKAVSLDFLPRQTALITFQTFTNRAWHDLGFNFVTNFRISYFAREYLYSTLKAINKTLRRTRQEAASKSSTPRFIYTHLMMPHFPFYFHKDGMPFPDSTLREEQQDKKESYVDYLQYSNMQYLSLIDHILRNSKEPPVILFLSDHGYRHFADTAIADVKLKYMNLMSIYLPGRQYDSFPDSLSNVNYLRSFFNLEFDQNFSMLADSIFIPVPDPRKNEIHIKAQKWP
jgi:hypothetical protein